MASKNAETRPKYAYQGPTLRREKTRGDIEREITTILSYEGSRLLYINWKKKTAHYVDAHGTKRSEGINMAKPRMRRTEIPKSLPEPTNAEEAMQLVEEDILKNRLSMKFG